MEEQMEKKADSLPEEALAYKKKNIFEELDESQRTEVMKYAEGYAAFLDRAKTEREAVAVASELLTRAGYTPYVWGEPLAAGDKKYYVNRKKSIFAFRIGTEPIQSDGIRILGAHIDSPRLDLKQVPLYEEDGLAYLKTHYYGGIKKFQWLTLPLALHGVVVLRDGSEVAVCIGERPEDPVFYITDILPHLGQEQSAKPLGTAIPGETLNLLVGGVPLAGEGGTVKLNVLRLLHECYGIEEEDFLSAELSAVPALRARDIGLDRSFIGAYGHDDRVCAYPALTALLDTPDTAHTLMTVLVDKEETGSDGNTGMQCRVFEDLITEIALAFGANPRLVRASSMCLSADVNAAYDPNYASVFEKRNSALISCGTVMSKYTGSRGKSGTSDASAEFVGRVRRIFAEDSVIWQSAELGRIDMGGGGTIAKFVAKLNIDTVDIGVPVLSMHAPYEVISKADLYMTYKGFLAFCRSNA